MLAQLREAVRGGLPPRFVHAYRVVRHTMLWPCEQEMVAAIPSIVAKYAVGFGDGVPALDVVQGGAIRLACFDVLGIEFGLQLASLCVRERHHFVLTVRVGLILLS
jgi:hypothetical protein